MTRADWQAAIPKCPHGQSSNMNMPGAICGEPLRWEPWILDDDGTELGRWVCAPHGVMLTGEQAAQRAGYRGMWFAGAV